MDAVFGYDAPQVEFFFKRNSSGISTGRLEVSSNSNAILGWQGLRAALLPDCGTE